MHAAHSPRGVAGKVADATHETCDVPRGRASPSTQPRPGRRMTSDLRRGVALVTGASQGIGAAISLALADAGMTVWMVARTADALQRAAAHVGPGARPFAADLTDPVARAALVDAVAAERRALDVLVHNAGIIHLGRIDEASEDEFREQVEVNVLAPYALTRSCLVQLRESQGQIVFINSSAGKTANPGVGQFSATQHAVRAIRRQPACGGQCRWSSCHGHPSRSHGLTSPGDDPRYREPSVRSRALDAAERRRRGSAGGTLPATYGRGHRDRHQADAQELGRGPIPRRWRSGLSTRSNQHDPPAALVVTSNADRDPAVRSP